MFSFCFFPVSVTFVVGDLAALPSDNGDTQVGRVSRVFTCPGTGVTFATLRVGPPTERITGITVPVSKLVPVR